jgi:FkbM family methyltransferase
MELAGREDRFVRLSKRGIATIIGFEPLPEECAKLNEKSDSSRRYLPYAIADGSKRTLYVTNTGMTSSLLPPNQDVTALFMNLSELMQVVRTEEIATRRLDDIPEIVEAGCDLLKVDVQGLEFEIFCHATNVLSNCLVIQTEVEFVPLYLNQPLFAEVDQVLRKNGFAFHKFLGLSGRPFKPLMKNNNPNASISQVLWSDAVYVRDFTQLHRLAPEKLLKLVVLLHELYGSVDLCHHVLTIYDQKTGEALASRYLEQLAQKSENPTEINQTNPAQIAQQLDLGIKHHQSGQLSQAEACFQQVLQWQANNADAWHLLGVIAAQQKQYSTAIERINRAIALKPAEATFYSNLGNVYLEQNMFQLACESYQTALQLQPKDADIPNKLALACEKLLDLGIEHHQAERLPQAATCYQQVLRYQPDRADGWHLWGVIAYEGKEYTTAIERINRAIVLNPNVANFYNSLGSVYQRQRNLTEATECYQKAIQLESNFENAYNNLGLVLNEERKLEEAIQCYQKILQLRPDAVDTYASLGIALQELGKVEEAIEALQTALQLQPDHQVALKQYVWARRRICHWDGLASFETSLISRAQSEQWATSPFPLLSVSDDPAVHLAAAKKYCTNNIGNSFPPLWHGQQYTHDKIRLAYLSANFHQHAVTHLMAELFERHDRSRFELFAISFGPENNSPMRQRLVKAFDRFIDVRQMSHLEAAQQIRDLEIDIAVDLQGYTRDCRPQILAHRPAPIQVNYLGYPGTLGADFIDYILVDPFIVPPDQQPFFTEKLVHLPDCYLVNDSQRIIADHTPSRQECGLPEQGFIFCSFNNAYKITPTIFDLWMRLLKAVPDSVLWLSGKNKLMEDNLRREAQTREVAPDRLIFAPREQNLSDHLARHRLADLFLDTLPYNAHTTTSDALWAGLPVLTCTGQSFAARVAGSLLYAIGLPELVTYNLEDYEALALKLATEPDQLRQIKAKLELNRLSTPLFDCDRFRRHIESAYTEMWSIWQGGEKPKAFAVPQEN